MSNQLSIFNITIIKTILLFSFMINSHSYANKGDLSNYDSKPMSFTNLYPSGNAAHPTIETNSIGGWSEASTTVLTSIDAFVGNHSISISGSSNSFARGEYAFNTVAGQDYIIKIHAKGNMSQEPGFYGWVGFSNFDSGGRPIISNDWTEYTFHLTATGSSSIIRVYPSKIGTPSLNETIYIDNVFIETVTNSAQGNPSDGELFVLPNSASTFNETNATSGWQASGTRVVTTDEESYVGTRSIRVEGRNGSNDRSEYVFNAVIGEEYNIKIHAKAGSGSGTKGFFSWTGLNGFTSQPVTSTNWTEYSFNVIANTTTPRLRLYATNGHTGVPGDVLYIDNVSIIPASYQDDTGGDDTTETTSGHWTKTASDIYYEDGNVGIGTQNIGEWQLAVGGKIRAEEIKVETGWADYVFKDTYKLPTLEEVEKHIQEKGHLINIPSALEVQTNGIELGKMNKLLLEKIEELTLYILDQERRILTLENQKNERKP